VRELLVHFRTRTNSEDIEQAVEVTLSKFEHQSGIRSRLKVTGHGVPLHSDTQLQVLHELAGDFGFYPSLLRQTVDALP
jgi:two-component system, NarL family, nitrate/nitrite sensor histidine kinase NarX